MLMVSEPLVIDCDMVIAGGFSFYKIEQEDYSNE